MVRVANQYVSQANITHVIFIPSILRVDAFSAAKVVYEKYEQEFLVRSLADICKLSFPCHREDTNDPA